ncbi:MAG: ABC transporter permease [Acidimicrobiia bacterium]|nr:ABC transporter permease [Acidimicrobiia bacterium]
MTIPTHLATHRELGVLRRFRASGLGAGALVASEVALGTVLGVLAAAVVLGAGSAVYGVESPDDPLGVVAWFGVGLACFIAIGAALGSLVAMAAQPPPSATCCSCPCCFSAAVARPVPS